MAQTALVQKKYLDDLLKWEVDPRFTRTSGTIKNGTGAGTTALTDVLGLPVKNNAGQFETILAAGANTCTGLVIGGGSLEALANNGISAKKYVILERGPALVNKTQIKTADLAASPGSYTLATLVTALSAVGIKCMAEPSDITTIQTT